MKDMSIVGVDPDFERKGKEAATVKFVPKEERTEVNVLPPVVAEELEVDEESAFWKPLQELISVAARSENKKILFFIARTL
jgi:hypothetical protein